MSRYSTQSRRSIFFRISIFASAVSILCIVVMALSHAGLVPLSGQSLIIMALVLALLFSLLHTVNVVLINRSEAEIEQATESIDDVTDKIHELAERSERLQSKIAAASQSIDELDDAIAVGRLADVEHIAISAALLAASSPDESGRIHLPPSQHGHSLLIRELFADSANNRIAPPQADFHLLEIGTTRERWWPQMSTHRLASVCRALHLRMLTVDVDSVGVEAVRDIEEHYPNVVTAVTERGETFLEAWEGTLPPYIYLDGYDFDHAGHSQERQDRYIELQGTTISDEACWEMHRRCAAVFIEKCSVGGKVVFDDAFCNGESWSGKAKIAIPLMLENGFKIVSATHATVLLQKI